MGEDPLKWFLPIFNSLDDGVAFPVSEDVRGILLAMRNDLGRGEGAMDENDEDTKEYRHDESGRCMMHD